MKVDSFSPHTAVSATEAKFELTYGEFIDLVRERRLAELEQTHPGETKRNNNIAGNIVRAVKAFMKANNLRITDVLGSEMRDETRWEAARDLMGPKAGSNKSLVGKARIWAFEAFRANETQYDDETFGERLKRLREVASFTRKQLADAVSTSAKSIDPGVLKNWERGARLPSANSLLAIERMEECLDVPPGTLTQKMSKVSYRAASVSMDIPKALKRRVSSHLPHDFDSRTSDEQDEIMSWVAANILSAPQEIFEDGTLSKGQQEDVFVFALAREAGGRSKVAPAHLIAELDEIGRYKTAELPPRGLKRGKKAAWGKAAHEKNDYDLRAFFGALDQMGLPPSSQSMSILLAPEAIERFIQWRYERRGAYTTTLTNLLQILISLLQPEIGFLSQMKDYGAPLKEIPGFIDKETVTLANDDWETACERSKNELRDRVTHILEVHKKGRDPFEAILPVIEDPEPLHVYWNIVDEIRARMPGSEYPLRVAEALRSLMILRVGLGSGLRSKNLRELLFCPKVGTPRTEKELRRLNRGEMRWKDGSWWIAMPNVAFKNFKSPAVEEWNEFPLMDPDGELDADVSKYLSARSDLLAGHPDPGTLFVKTMKRNSKHASYDLTGFYNAFRAVITTYGIYNPWTGRGAIKGLRPHGPHSMRHVLGTHLIKNSTASDAGAALFDTEEMIRNHYGKYSADDRHRDAMRKAWAGFSNKKRGAAV